MRLCRVIFDILWFRQVALHAKANQLAAVCLQELQESCDREIESISSPKIRGAVDALASLDILPQTKEVCVGIAKKTCLERVKQWVNSHVTLGKSQPHGSNLDCN